jgi:hypothetical protein
VFVKSIGGKVMNKFEREWAEVAEKKVASAMNVDTHHRQISDSVVTFIENTHQAEVVSAKWVGSESYDEAGDIHVFLENNKMIPVELKVSKENGSGTKANPSTNLLKKYIPEATNYPDHEALLLVERYDFIESLTGTRPVKPADYSATLREFRADGRKDVLDKIVEITTPGQVAYATYAAELLNDNPEATQMMVNDILEGNNTTKDTVTTDLVYCVVKHYQTAKQTVEFYKFEEMDSNVRSVTSEGKSIKIQNQAGYDILRFSVHWKNICQGGSNPCFNVFVGNAYGK